MRKLLVVIFLCLLSRIASADHRSSSEYEIKGAFLYNFAKFVEWPAADVQKSSETFVLGILGRDPFGNQLDELLDGKTVQDKKIILKRFDKVAEVSGCNVLFISASEEKSLPSILADLKGRPILTVSDMPDFVEEGGVVGFSVEGKKVRFSINTKAADSANLKVSSQLLKLAKSIISTRLRFKSTFAWLPLKHIPSKRS